VLQGGPYEPPWTTFDHPTINLCAISCQANIKYYFGFYVRDLRRFSVRVQGSPFRVQSSPFRAQGSPFPVQDSPFLQIGEITSWAQVSLASGGAGLNNL
jgi:hypothetical protein